MSECLKNLTSGWRLMKPKCRHVSEVMAAEEMPVCTAGSPAVPNIDWISWARSGNLHFK